MMKEHWFQIHWGIQICNRIEEMWSSLDRIVMVTCSANQLKSNLSKNTQMCIGSIFSNVYIYIFFFCITISCLDVSENCRKCQVLSPSLKCFMLFALPALSTSKHFLSVSHLLSWACFPWDVVGTDAHCCWRERVLMDTVGPLKYFCQLKSNSTLLYERQHSHGKCSWTSIS